MNKTVSVIIIIGLIIVLGIVFAGGSKPDDNTSVNQAISNVEIKDGVQYVTIRAGGGYTPKISSAQAGLPTKLIMKTNGIYDCSASLVIRSIGFQQILPQTGETEINLGIPKAGVPLQGLCGMGMYNFSINFN